MEGIRRPVFSGLTAVGSVGALVAGLAVIDPRVREEITALFSRGPADDLAKVGTGVQDLIALVFVAVRDQTIDHAPMVIFALAAIVLVMFMMRT
jgi:hypothetical protein